MNRNAVLFLLLPVFLVRATILHAQAMEGIPPGRRSGSTSRRSVTPPSAAAKQLTPLDIEQSMPDPCHIPDLSNVGGAPKIAPAQPEPCDQPLPINLASAMRLADARPLVIQAAMASEMTVAGQLDKAKVLWLPDVYLGTDYQRHDGGAQRTTGDVAINDRNQFLAGGGLKAVFGLTDAIYAPLAAQQVFRARNYDIQTAKNDALLSVTDAFFNVQQARGILAGYEDTVAKGRELVERVEALAQGLAAPIEVQRAQTTLSELEQQTALARQDWRTSSATLTRVLRLNPAAVIIPLEPPQLQVTIIPLNRGLGDLIPSALSNRPELASQQSLVKASLARLKAEKMRPLIPILVAQGTSNPGSTLGGGFYAANVTPQDPTWTGRSDWDVQVLWQLQNLGAGNAALVRERQGEERQAMVEFSRIQDQVAAEVAQSSAQVQAAATRIQEAEYGLAAAEVSFEGNLKGVSETIRAGNQLQLVIRPQEVTASLLQLRQAYSNYYTSVNDFNRAQFRLYHALGYASDQLTQSSAFGDPQALDCDRQPQLAAIPPRSAVGPGKNLRR